MSAYLLYQNAMREQFKAQNPGMTFGQLAKYTSAMYAEMPPAEKQAWVARAEADKQRYLHELANYVPPPGYDSKGDAIMTPVRSGKKRSGGAVKDANAPKRNMSAYLLYQNAMREQFKRENPGMTFGQLAKYTSHMYKNLTPEEKAAWDARATQDKARYDAQMANYVPPPGHDSRGNLVEEYRVTGKRQKRAPKDPAAPKRARGSFVFFTFEHRPQIIKEFPGIKFVEMGTILGERWRALIPQEKKRYEDMAAEDKIRFHMEMQKYTAEMQMQEPEDLTATHITLQHIPPHITQQLQHSHLDQHNLDQQHLDQSQLDHIHLDQQHLDHQHVDQVQVGQLDGQHFEQEDAIQNQYVQNLPEVGNGYDLSAYQHHQYNQYHA